MLRGSNALPWLGFWIRLGAAAVWIITGAAKIPHIQAFHVLVQRYGMLPEVFSGPFAYILPFLEVAIGLYFAVGLFVRGTAFAGTVLFALFLIAQSSALIRESAWTVAVLGQLPKQASARSRYPGTFASGSPLSSCSFFQPGFFPWTIASSARGTVWRAQRLRPQYLTDSVDYSMALY